MSKGKLTLVTAGVAFGAAILLWLIWQTIVAAIIGGVVGGLVVLFMLGRQVLNENDSQGDASTAPSPQSRLDTALQSLINVQLTAREHGLNQDCLDDLSLTIEALHKLLVGLYTKDPDGMSTVEVANFALRVIPQTVNGYVDLAPVARTQRQELFQSALRCVDEAVQVSQANLDQGRDIAFRVQNEMFTEFGVTVR